MKLWLVILIASLLGVGIGVGITVAEFAPAEELFVAAEGEGKPIDPANLTGGSPTAVVEGATDYDFGVMERNVARRHEFVLKNTGTAPLTIEVGTPSCKCTVVKSPKKELKPDEETAIEIEWTPKGYTEGFRQSVELTTNDPKNPIIRLAIHGNVIQAVKPVPEEIRQTGVSANEENRFDVKIYGFDDQPLEILKHELLMPEYADRFAVEITPLTADEIREQNQAKSGQKVTLIAKSGLPIGAVNQTIRLETNIATATEIEIPVHLAVASDIALFNASPRFQFVEDKNLLRLGKLKSQTGAKAKLFVLVRGPHRNETKIHVASIDPANVLKAKLGEPETSANGALIKYPLEIEIPPGTPAMDRFGGEQSELGKIVLSTTHPVAKEVRLFMQFAVE
jgi:hypothetical protein